MPAFKISRSNEYVNRLRAIKIFANGNLLGQVSNGEVKEFVVSESNCTIQAKVDWCSSNSLSLNLNENAVQEIHLSSFAANKPLAVLSTLYYIFFATGKYLQLKLK